MPRRDLKKLIQSECVGGTRSVDSLRRWLSRRKRLRYAALAARKTVDMLRNWLRNSRSVRHSMVSMARNGAQNKELEGIDIPCSSGVGGRRQYVVWRDEMYISTAISGSCDPRGHDHWPRTRVGLCWVAFRIVSDTHHFHDKKIIQEDRRILLKIRLPFLASRE